MKKILFLSCFCILSVFVLAQEKTNVKEVGLAFSGLNSFGLTYRLGKENALWRFNALAIGGNQETQDLDSMMWDNMRNELSISIGREFRSEIAEKLIFRYGLDLNYNYQRSESDREETNRNGTTFKNYNLRLVNNYGVRFVLGLNYKLSDNIILGAEILPDFSYRKGEIEEVRETTNQFQSSSNLNRKGDISGFNYGLSSGSALLTLVYQFN